MNPLNRCRWDSARQVRFQPRHSSRWNTQLHLLGCLVKALDHDPMLQTQLDAVKKHGRLSPVELKVRQLVEKDYYLKAGTFLFWKQLYL